MCLALTLEGYSRHEDTPVHQCPHEGGVLVQDVRHKVQRQVQLSSLVRQRHCAVLWRGVVLHL